MYTDDVDAWNEGNLQNNLLRTKNCRLSMNDWNITTQFRKKSDLLGIID